MNPVEEMAKTILYCAKKYDMKIADLIELVCESKTHEDRLALLDAVEMLILEKKEYHDLN